MIKFTGIRDWHPPRASPKALLNIVPALGSRYPQYTDKQTRPLEISFPDPKQN